MGIDDQVRYDSLLSEGEILLSIGHTASSLLTMPRCKFVTDLRSLDRSSLDFDEQVVGCVIFRDHDLIDDSIFRVSGSLRGIFEGLSHSWLTIKRLLVSWLDYFTNNDVISTEFGSRADETITVELVILTVSQSSSVLRVHISDPLGFRGSVIVASEKHRSEEASVDSALVDHDRILLIVACIAGNGNDGVTARWKLLEMEILHGFGYDQWLLRIVENISEGIHPEMVVARVNSHSLLSHCTLIGVSWRLIVIWEWNDRGTDSQYHRRVDLTVSILVLLLGLKIVLDIFGEHGNHSRFFLFDIKKLNEAFPEELLEHPLLLEDHFDMLSPDHHLVIFNNEHGSLHSSGIGVYLDLLLFDISHDRIFLGQRILSPGLSDIAQEL